MEQREILKQVDEEMLRHWLSCCRLPMVVEPCFFEHMGFPSWFVRQYFRKHSGVLQMDGRVQRNVRGVSEAGFLWGLAEAIGADTTEADRTRSNWKRTRLCVEACLAALDRIKSTEQVKAQ